MTSKRTFYRAVFQVELLSEEPIDQTMSLGDIGYHMTEGHCSGVLTCEKHEEVDAVAMAKLLIKQRSDPDFFTLDADGNDVEDR